MNRFSRTQTLVSGALFLLGFVAPAFAKTETVTGKLVDLSCYEMDKENTGNAHKGKGLICGQACARESFPVGLLTPGGKVYQVRGELSADGNVKLVPHIGQTVTITGDVSDAGGLTTIAANELK